MFEKKVWNDRQSEHPARRRLTPTENDNEYEVSRAEGLVMEEGDAFDATTMNDLENRVAKAFAEYDPAELGAVNVTVQLYTCKKEGKVYQLTGSGAVGRCKIPAAWASGDTWKVNGTAVPAYCGADAVDGDCVVAGRWVLFTFDGAQLNFNGGGGLSNGKLARATASEAQVLAGAPFYAGNKTLKIGMMRNHGSWPDADKLTIESGKLKMYKQDGYTEGGLGVAATNLGNAQAEHLLDTIKEAPRDESVEARVQAEVKDLTSSLRKAKQRLEETAQEQEGLEMEVARCLLGKSNFTTAMLSKLIDDKLKEKHELENQVLDLERRLANQKEMSEKVSEYYNRFLGWSMEFGLASIERKRIIISQLYKRIELGRGYVINFEVDWNYEQFIDTLMVQQNKGLTAVGVPLPPKIRKGGKKAAKQKQGVA